MEDYKNPVVVISLIFGITSYLRLILAQAKIARMGKELDDINDSSISNWFSSKPDGAGVGGGGF